MTDLHANFAYSTVATAPSPATSGTSLVVAAGQGALFPTPPFNATVWPASVQPLSTNAEIVRVTGVSTDTLTITRATESTSARTVVVGDQIAATITKKTLTDAETPVLIADTTLGSPGSLDLTSIPATYTHLKLIAIMRTERANTIDNSLMRFNGDTGSNYDWIYNRGSGTTGGVFETKATSSLQTAVVPAANSPAGYWGTQIIDIPFYAMASVHRTFMARAVGNLNTGSSNLYLSDYHGAWLSTTAVNQITIFGSLTANLQTGSRAMLYGY